MSQQPKVLVLDFGGVISRTLYETHDLTEAALGLKPGTLNWRGPFDLDSDPVFVSMQKGEITEREYWEFRMRETGDLVGETWNAFPEFIGRVRGNDPAAVIRPEFLETIAKAKSAGVRLAILSNELDLFYGKDFREKLPFMQDFELIVDATYTGILKPDPRAFAFITEGLGVAASDCVFVDDQLKNIRGGEAAGMHCVHFDVTQPDSSYAKALKLLGVK